MIENFKYRISILKRLALYANGVEKFFVLKIVTKMVMICISLMLPIFYKNYIEKVIIEKQMKWLYFIVCGYILAQLLTMGGELLSNKCTYTLNNKLTVRLRLKFLDKRFGLKFDEYNGIENSNEKMLFDDAIFKLCDFSGVQSIDYYLTFIQTIILCILLFALEWKLAILMIISIPITMWLNDKNAKLAKVNNNMSWNNDRLLGNHIYSSFNSWREIRAMQMEKQCEEVFSEYSDICSGLFRVYTRFWVTRRFLLPKIKEEFLMQVLLIFTGGLLIMDGKITVGVLLAFIQYYNQLASSFQLVVNTDADLKINSVHYDKVFEVIDSTTANEKLPDCEAENVDFVVNNISFSYDKEDSDIFRDFSLTIKQGERVGIVGESGSGKSTLLNLLVGILEPNEGDIYFGEKNLKEYNLDFVQKRVGFVLQDNMIFNTSIRENLLYVKPEATDEEIYDVCKRAHLLELIEKMPDGLESIVGERGNQLSGGEKQRLVLARAFLRDVDVFVFDEATSALDQKTENLIQEAISEISKEKTIIVVSHRASSLNVCDRFINIYRHM